MIRSILVLVFLLFYLILSLPLMGLEWLLGKISPRARDISTLRLSQGVFKIILFFCGTKLTIIGEDKVPKDRPLLYVANHRSYFDVVITYSRVPDLTGYIAKAEMKKVPLVRLWMGRLYCLFLERKDLKQGMQTIMTAISQIKQGISIFVYPEGTRGKGKDSTDMLPFHDGSFRPATKTDCPIIPVSLTNTSSILEDHFPFIRRTHVIVEYGDPIIPSQLDPADRKHLGSYVQNIIRESLERNQKLV